MSVTNVNRFSKIRIFEKYVTFSFANVFNTKPKFQLHLNVKNRSSGQKNKNLSFVPKPCEFLSFQKQKSQINVHMNPIRVQNALVDKLIVNL